MDTKTYEVVCKALKSAESLSVSLNVQKEGKTISSRVRNLIEADLDSLFLTDAKHNIYNLCGMKDKKTELPVTVKVAPGTTNLKETFSHCYTLETLDVSHMDVANVTNMESLFYTCSKITSLDISTWDTSKVQNFKSTFSYCSKLTEINGVIDMASCASVEDAKYMFSNCSALQKVKIKNPPADFLEQKVFSINKNPKYGYEVLGLNADQFEIVR